MAGKYLPRLADVQCSKMQFSPGDRILVRLQQPGSTREDRAAIKRMVEKWAGDIVEVLVVDPGLISIDILKATK